MHVWMVMIMIMEYNGRDAHDHDDDSDRASLPAVGFRKPPPAVMQIAVVL